MLRDGIDVWLKDGYLRSFQRVVFFTLQFFAVVTPPLDH